MEKDIEAAQKVMGSAIVDGSVEDSTGYFYNADGDVIFTMTGLGGGGGGGGSGDTSGSVVTLTNETGWASTAVAEGADVILALSWSSIEDGNETGGGTLQVSVGGLTKEMRAIPQGNFTVNVKNYLNVGSNRVGITVTDVNGRSKSKNFLISVEQLVINSTFDSSLIQHGTLTFTYTPYGAFTKTIHFEVDGSELTPEITAASGRQLSKVIPAQTHGAHTLRVWFEAEIGEVLVPSNELVYDIMWIISGNDAPVISSNFNQTAVSQYSTITVPFMVYTPNNPVSDVLVKVDDTVVSTLRNVDRTINSAQIRLDVDGEHVIILESGTATKAFTINVEESEIEIEAETDSLVLALTSTGRSNLEEHPEVWNYESIQSSLTGFNFVSNGWVRDDDNETVLRVNNGASVTIPYKPFATDFRLGGKTIEIEFAVRDVQNYNTSIISCMNGGRGLNITPQFATLKSEQSEITMQFKDEEHVRLAFVCEKRSEDRLLLAYVDAVPSGVVQYSADDDFSQVTPDDIHIGSNDCTVDIYCIRVYDNDLTRTQIMHNWIADTQNGGDMLARYSRNNVYDAYGSIVIDKLPSSLPYMVLQCPELPQYKGDKKTITGYYTDPANPSNSFSFENCQINVQGTSSAPYARKNYDMQFKGGFTRNGKNEKNYTLAPGIVPFNRFVMKADVASSEGANNVELVKLYCDISPFKTREMKADSRVRQGIYGFPIVIFWTNTDTGITSFLGKYNFNLPKRAPGPYGYSGDMESWEFQNNTSNLMLFKSDYFDETMRADPDTGEEKEAWRYDFEARFPSDEWVDYRQIQELVSFVVSTDRTKATGDALEESVIYNGVTYTEDTAEYRLAKFREEFPTYAELDSFLFYYIFTELFLMVDSRAKNLFIGFSGSDVTAPNRIATRKAVAEPYDMDTALGINNEGSLVFSYNLEDTDHTASGADVFNGQTSVLWNNVRDAYPGEITRMYQTLRSNSLLSYDTIENRFEAHQAMWPEAIWQEDSWFKYILPLTNPDPGKEPTDAYLDMMQGSKLQQRKWWLGNRFKYMDSKWNSGDALAEVIQFRAYNTASMTVTPYSDLYVTVKYGSYTGRERASGGEAVPMPVPVDSLSDTEIYVYSAPQIADIGDLSPFKPGWADFSKATRIQRIKIGDSSPSYENGNFTRLSLGNNRLLKVLDVRNCSALGTGPQKNIDLSGCTNLEEIYFDGTAISGVTLANTGVVKTLHLPDTITNLTLINQTKITDFTCPDYTNISTLRLENAPVAVNIFDILNDMPEGSRVRLYNFHWEFSSLSELADIYEKLDTMRGLDQNGNNMDKAQLYGTIYIPSLSSVQLEELRARYSDVTITYGQLISKLFYYDYYGNTLLYTETVLNDQAGVWPETPNKPTDTAQYTFGNFQGWALNKESDHADADARKNLVGDRNVYAAFPTTIRTYTATFIRSSSDGGGTLYTQRNIPYGTTPTYTGSTPMSTIGADMQFNGWSPELGPIEGNTTYTAVFKDLSSQLYKYIRRTLEDYESDTAEKVGSYAFYNYRTLKTITTSAKILEDQWLYKTENIEQITLTAPEITDWQGIITTSERESLQRIIIQSNTVPQFTGKQCFPNQGRYYIYVPDNLVDTYKNNNKIKGTSTEERIMGISDMYKYEWDETEILDDDATFFAAAADGSAATKYKLGNYKTVNLGSEGNIRFQIMGFNMRELADSTDTATIELLAMEPLATKHGYNPALNGNTEGTGSIGGYDKSELKTYIDTTIWQLFPEAWKNVIKETKINSCLYDTSKKLVKNNITTAKLRLPSYREMYLMGFTNNDSYYTATETSGPAYVYAAGTGYQRARNSTGYWLRSAYNDKQNYLCTNSGGVATLSSSAEERDILIGFSI